MRVALRALSLLLLVLVIAVPAVARQASGAGVAKRPLALEDYYRVKSVGPPRLSPDGRWVVYTVSLPVEATNANRTEVWLVGTDGRAGPRPVRHDGADPAEARWGEDGRLRYRAADATWILDPARPAAPPERDTAPATRGIVSPDGRWLARTQPVEPAPRPAPAMTDFERRHEERFRGAAFDWYPFRQDGQSFPLPDPRTRPATEVFVEPVDGSTPARQLTRLGLQASNLRWTPDGALVFTANEALLDENAYGANAIFRVTPDGHVERLTDGDHNHASVEISPDGRWMSWVQSYGTDHIVRNRLDHGGPVDLYIRPTAGGEPINLTAGFDLDAGAARWSPDSRTLYFTTGVGGAVHLFSVAVSGGGVRQVTRGERRIGNIDFDRAFRRIAYTVGELDRPADVYVADIDGRNERRLTDVHAELLAEVEPAGRPSERVVWNSYDGTPVEGFLQFPPGYDPTRGRWPLIVVNHGGPHAASGYVFNFKNSLFAAHGYVVFQPNFRGSTGYGTAFKWATWGGWGNLDGEDVMAGVDHLIAHFGIDPGRVGSTGHSYGGILTNWLITRYPDRFRAAVSGAGESNWTSNYALSDVARTKDTEFFGPPWDPRAREIMIAQSPYLNSAGVRAATLFVHGAVDYRVPLEGAIQLYTSLKRQGVPAKLIIYEDQAHGITGAWNNVHRMMHELRWWETYLKPETAGVSSPDAARAGRGDRP
jgi:dipeptidyl aminopeptidase/acylaminoacyl peptidase